MQFIAQWTVAALILCGLGPHCASAQTQMQKLKVSTPTASQSRRPQEPASPTLTPDDGLSVIASALDSHSRQRSERDCSHLVHGIYDRAGFPYSYVSSSSLYAGTKEFQRVSHAQPGDLVVWQGHVGIAVNPARHEFFSTLSSGPGIDTYDAPYWKQRGRLRFYRYIKASPARATSHRLVLTHESR